MIQVLLNYFESRSYKLDPRADCYLVTSPSGKQHLCNLRWKTRPVWGRQAKRWEWSIPLRDWRRYLERQVEILFVLEKASGNIFAAPIREVIPHARIYNGEDLDLGGTVFLPVDKYQRLATIALSKK